MKAPLCTKLRFGIAYAGQQAPSMPGSQHAFHPSTGIDCSPLPLPRALSKLASMMQGLPEAQIAQLRTTPGFLSLQVGWVTVGGLAVAAVAGRGRSRGNQYKLQLETVNVMDPCAHHVSPSVHKI